MNVDEPYKYITMYTVVLWTLAYLVFRNYAFNDEKYKTRLFFKTLPVTPKTIIGSRLLVVYLFCLIASPLIIASSNIFHWSVCLRLRQMFYVLCSQPNCTKRENKGMLYRGHHR